MFTPVQGLNTVKVRQTDVAGNVSPVTTFVFTLDTTAPRVTAVSLPAAGTYAVGSKISVTLTLSEAVLVGGTGAAPFLALRFGSLTRPAVLESGNGTNTLVFSYTVVSGDLAPLGVTFPTTISLPTGTTLSDAAGNAAVLTFALPSTLPRIVV